VGLRDPAAPADSSCGTTEVAFESDLKATPCAMINKNNVADAHAICEAVGLL
jgi:hypothetical protein